MKVVILAGGFGTRLSELTGVIPKPMALIGNDPIIIHIMKYYASHGHKDFIIALGYKAEVIKNYFANFPLTKSDYSINLSSREIKIHKKANLDWNVTLVDTGQNTMTGGRIKRLKSYIGENDFLLTYGDGVSDVDITSTIKIHEESSKLLTMTVVRPVARFGEIEIEGDVVKSFKEKPQLHQGWINGGFFVCKPNILDFIDGDKEMFEREPLQRIIRANGLGAYKHHGFWHCMDSKRDHEKLNEIWFKGKAPWA